VFHAKANTETEDIANILIVFSNWSRHEKAQKKHSRYKEARVPSCRACLWNVTTFLDVCMWLQTSSSMFGWV